MPSHDANAYVKVPIAVNTCFDIGRSGCGRCQFSGTKNVGVLNSPYRCSLYNHVLKNPATGVVRRCAECLAAEIVEDE